MASWIPGLGSPHRDLNSGERSTLVARSRDAMRNHLIARAAITRLRTNAPDSRPARTIQPQPAAPTALPKQQKTKKETWQRIELKPGVELHVRQPLSVEDQQVIDLIIGMVQK